MKSLCNLLGVPVFKQNIAKVRELMHDARRGALSELQVLELCQGCGMMDTDIADILDMTVMQPAELHILLGILSDEKRSWLLLLRKAVSQHLNHTTTIPVHIKGLNRQIMHGIRMPDRGDEQLYTAIPNSQIRLLVQNSTQGDL